MELSKSLATGLIIAASLLGGCASNHTQDQAQAYSQDAGSNQAEPKKQSNLGRLSAQRKSVPQAKPKRV